jgi:hypothetical protein
MPLSQKIAEAISARIICWEHGLGVSYEFPNGDREAHELGPDDRLVLDRFRRAGKLDYENEDVRNRYTATLSTDLPTRRGGSPTGY